MNAATSIQFDLTPPSEDQLRDLEADLSDDERHVLLEHGTEAPFCGVFLDEKRAGLYTCRLCGLPLFHGGQEVRERHRLAELHFAVLGRPSRRPFATPATAWSGPRSSAPAADRTRAMSSPTARRRPASDIASIRQPRVHAQRRSAARQARPGRARRGAVAGLKVELGPPQQLSISFNYLDAAWSTR